MTLDEQITFYQDQLIDELRGAPGPPNYDPSMKVEFLREKIHELEKLKKEKEMTYKTPTWDYDYRDDYRDDISILRSFAEGISKKEGKPTPSFVDPDVFIELEEGLL